MNNNASSLSAPVQVQERILIRNVYLWMTAGLFLTAVVARGVSHSPAILSFIFGNRLVFFALIIGELILVFHLARHIMHMSVGAAVLGFTAYAFLNGVTLASIFLIYTKSSISLAFFTSGATFAAMSLWALSTKRDLSGWGHYLFMGLIGLIIAGVLGMFIGGGGFQMVYSAAGVLLFTGLTAYDTQMIKKMGREAQSAGEADYIRLSILGALKLYLDFINLFLFFLRFLGRRD